MTFSLEQALAEYFDNTGGGGLWYGGTGTTGQITGSPTGGGAAPTGSGAASGSSAGGSVAQVGPTASGIDLFTLLVALFLPWQATTIVEAAAGSEPIRHGGPNESWFNQLQDALNIPYEVRRVYSNVPSQYPQPPEWYYMNFDVRPWPESSTWPGNTWPGGPLGLDPADDAAQQYYLTGQFWESWFALDSYYSYVHFVRTATIS